MYDRGSNAPSVPAELRHLISPFADVRERYPVYGGLGDSFGGDVSAGGSTGAAVGSVIPGVGTVVGATVGTIGGALASLVHALGGGGTPDAMKAIWAHVPLSATRLSGGHGTWHDTLTGEVLTDAQSDVRKSAVIASAIHAFNDAKNWWYDATSQTHLSGADALARWNSNFGGADFANAYAVYPQAFQIFGPTSAGDPHVHAPGAMIVPTQAPPVTSVYATPAQVAAAGLPPGTPLAAPAQASLIGGLSTTTLLLLGGGVLVGIILLKRSRSRGS